MEMWYQSGFLPDTGEHRFYATYTLKLEEPDVHQHVYMYLSLKTLKDKYWDVGRCHVQYSGTVNLPYRRYSMTDHYSEKRPYYGGLDEHLKLDKYQDWVINQKDSSSTCPGMLQKCTFICSFARKFETGWNDDFDMYNEGPIALNVAYMVYD